MPYQSHLQKRVWKADNQCTGDYGYKSISFILFLFDFILEYYLNYLN